MTVHQTEKVGRRGFLTSGVVGATLLLHSTDSALGGAAREDAQADKLGRSLNSKFRPQSFAHLPTPLEPLRALGGEIGCPNLYVKRDDQTGLALGGNKTRKLEYIIADALRKKADSIVTWAGIQSNWCRQMAAAARKFGLKPILILSKREPGPADYDGNLLLDFLLDAEVHLLEPGADASQFADEIVRKEKNQGRSPYLVPVGGSRPGGSMAEPLGAIGYANAFFELQAQAGGRNLRLGSVVLATGSGGTQAGLIVGAKAASPGTRIVGISVSGNKAAIQKVVSEIADATAAALGFDFRIPPEEVIVFDDYVGEGYGKLYPAVAESIRRLATREGILLDPVYTGKAVTGLLDLFKRGYFARDPATVFLHTGGTPALFVYRDQLQQFLKGKPS